MKVLSDRDLLLVAGGYNSSEYSGVEPSNGYVLPMPDDDPDDEDPGDPPPTPPPPPPSGPQVLSELPMSDLSGQPMTSGNAEDAEAILALMRIMAEADYSDPYYHELDPRDGGGQASVYYDSSSSDAYTFAAWSSWSPAQPAYDQSVASALASAGIPYEIRPNGSIYAPGYGFAVASTGTPGGLYTANMRSSAAVASYTDSSGSTLSEVYDPNTITVYGGQFQFAQLQAGPVIYEALKAIVYGIIGNFVYDEITDPSERAAKRAADMAKLETMENKVATLFNPNAVTSETNVLGRDGGRYSGWMTNNGWFFADVSGNGKPDVVFSRNSFGYWANFGNGWQQIANPFRQSPF